MARSIAASVLCFPLLLATPAWGMTGWWTWSPDILTPHFAFQDPGSGNILHSACNSNSTAIFPTDEPRRFALKLKPKPATPLAVVGWWDDDLETPIASVFYQASDDSIVNAYFQCNYTTGDYVIDPDGEYKVSSEEGVPSVHESTGLAVVELGDAGGSRVFYHDEDGRVNLLAYDDDTDWQYRGPVSRMNVSSMSLASVQTVGVNVSVVFPHDEDNLAVAKFSEKGKERWSLSSLPTGFESPTPTNKTNPSDISLESSRDAPFSLPSLDVSTSYLSLASNSDSALSIFYIGTDRRLHQLSEAEGTWEVVDRPSEKQWPEADDESARLALVSPQDSDEIWIYYRSGGDIVELYQDGDGVWAESKKTLTGDGTTAAPEGDDNSDEEESSGEKDSETTDDSADTGTTEEEASQGGGLSTGAKAGIGVGASVGAVAMVLVVAMFFHRRRASRAQEKKHSPEGEYRSPAYANVTTYSHYYTGSPAEAPAELPPDPKYELLGDVQHQRPDVAEVGRT